MKTEKVNEKKCKGETSELGKKLREIRRQMEVDKDFKPLTAKQVRKEVQNRRNGDFEK